MLVHRQLRPTQRKPLMSIFLLAMFGIADRQTANAQLPTALGASYSAAAAGRARTIAAETGDPHSTIRPRPTTVCLRPPMQPSLSM